MLKEETGKNDLYRFLLNYRATPHSSTTVTPAELLFNRKIATNLPEVVDDQEGSDTELQLRDSQAKQKMKAHADRRVRVQESILTISDTVLTRQKKRSKFSTRFDPSPYKVVEVKGNSCEK